MDNDPIGVFDSGIGGLSVLRHIREELPHEDLIYIADSGHLPYGSKTRIYIEKRAVFLTEFLIGHRAKAIVVACNTATAAAIAHLRSIFSRPIIGIEPGVKPALSLTKTGIVGILATGETLKSQKFEDLTSRFCKGHQLVVQDCPGLVEQVEKLELNAQTTRDLLKGYISTLLDKGADTIVLGCTHYPFLSPLIKEMAGPGVMIIDTGLAVAREVTRRLKETGLLSDNTRDGWEEFWATGDPSSLKQALGFLWKRPVGVQVI